MFKSKLRLLGVRCACRCGAVSNRTGQGLAWIFSLGEVEVTIDTTLSVGASFVAADGETEYLPATNGGPVDQSIYFAEGLELARERNRKYGFRSG